MVVGKLRSVNSSFCWWFQPEMELQVTYRSELELLTCTYPTSELKYRVFQIYGQKYVKLLDSTWNPEPVTEVFASNIPRSIATEKLFEFFARCGEIYQIRLLMDFSGYNRGKCFVQYRKIRASREAICCLHDEEIDSGHRVVVKLSLNNNQLILKSIPEWISEEFIKDVLMRFIGEGLIRIVVRKSRMPFKNHCVCTYRDHQFAIMAHKKSWPVINIAGMIVDVHWATPNLLRFSTNLYFTNFPPDMTKNELFETLGSVIDLRSLVQFRLINSCGYIMFFNNTALAEAAEALRDLTINGFSLKFSRLPFRSNDGDEYYQRSIPIYSSFPPFSDRYVLPGQMCPCSVNVPFLMPQTAAGPSFPFCNGNNGCYAMVSWNVKAGEPNGPIVYYSVEAATLLQRIQQ